MENSGFKILIVDDGLLNREVLRRILRSDHVDSFGTAQPNYILTIAGSGQEALDKIEDDKPDLILLDIVMPGMSGFEVLSKLKETESTRSIPVMIITGLDKVEDEEKGFFLGAVDYITKPFHESLVKARIKTQLKIVEQMHLIEQLSLIDPLTNIPNRRSFDNHMLAEWGHAIRGKTPVSLLMIDVDHFKKFNDTYGHQQGDVVLKTVAGTIKSTLKRQIDLAARWGGEEFTVLLPNTELAGALLVAESIRVNIESAVIPNIANTAPLKVNVSIGVASAAPSTDSLIADFIEQADKALYAAKQTGRNRVCS